jgi:hypothetical protein
MLAELVSLVLTWHVSAQLLSFGLDNRDIVVWFPAGAIDFCPKRPGRFWEELNLPFNG